MANIYRIINSMRNGHEARAFVAENRRRTTWYLGPHLHTGHRLHGDQLDWMDPAPYSRDMWWPRVMMWFVLFGQEAPGNANATIYSATNTRTQIRNFRVQVRRTSWTVAYLDPAPASNQYFHDTTTEIAPGGSRDESGNGGGRSHRISNDGTVICHGYGSPFLIPDPWNVTGLAFDFECRKILDNPAGTDDRANAHLVIHCGADPYPETFIWRGSTALPIAGFWPAIGAGSLMIVRNSWERLGFTTYFEGSRNVMTDFSAITPSLLLADPPIDWTTTDTGGGGGGTGGGVIVTPPPPANARRILFMGDDLIRGDEATANSYRSIRGPVLQTLAAQGLSIDALGRERLTPAAGGDPDHEGHLGALISTSSNNLATRLPTIAQTSPNPEVVVLWIGRGDYVTAASGIGDRIAAHIDDIRSKYPSTLIVAGTLPPTQGRTEAETGAQYPGYAGLNSRLRGIAETTFGVLLADVAAGATFASSDYVDEWRLNDAGAAKAGAVFAAQIGAALGASSRYLIPGRRPIVTVWRSGTTPGVSRVVRRTASASAPAIGRMLLGPFRRLQPVVMPLQVTGSPDPAVTLTGTPPAGTVLSRVAYRDTFDVVGGWTSNGGAPTVAGGWIRPANNADSFLVSPAGLGVAAAQATQVRARIRRVGSGHVWEGRVFWKRTTDAGFDVARSVLVGQPTWDDAGIGVITWTITDPAWSGTIDQLRFDILVSAADTGYLEIDSIAIGSGIAAIPPGMLPESNILVGTPTTNGTSSLTVTATNANGTASRTYAITVMDVPTVTTAALPVAIVGTPYRAPLTAIGEGPFVWGVQGAPDAMGVPGQELIGDPVTPGTYSVTLTAANAVGVSEPVVLPLVVATAGDAPQVLTASLPDGQVGTAYHAPLVVAGATPRDVAVVAGALPNGLAVLYHGGNINEFADAGAGTAGWSKIDPDSALSVVGGVLRSVATASDDWAGAWRHINTVPGTVYRVRVRIVSLTGPVYLLARSPTLWPPTTDSTIWIVAPGVYETEHVAETTTMAVGVQSGLPYTAYTIEWDDLTVHPLRRNLVRNPTGLGATNGTIGSGGVLPTHWQMDGAGVARVVTASQSIGALEATRFRAHGTLTQAWLAFRPDIGAPRLIAPARPGQAWSGQVVFEAVAGTFPSALWSLYLEEWRANDTWIRGTRVAFFAGVLGAAQQVVGSVTTGSECAGVRLVLSIEGISGAIDFTFDVGGLQLELAAAPTAWTDPRYPYVAGVPSQAGAFRPAMRASNSAGATTRVVPISIGAGANADPVPRRWEIGPEGGGVFHQAA